MAQRLPLVRTRRSCSLRCRRSRLRRNDIVRETDGTGKMSEGLRFDVRGLMFSELRTLNFELRIAHVAPSRSPFMSDELPTPRYERQCRTDSSKTCQDNCAFSCRFRSNIRVTTYDVRRMYFLF